ncbi:MAG: ABC transporter ATP-binding protein [Candidatus Helarchaeota archaeon]
MPNVKLENINVKDALYNINLHVQDGEFLTICGPTGAGKSTMLKIIAGLIKPDSGRVYFDKVDITDKEPEERGIGMVFEHSTYALFPHLNVEKNVGYNPRVLEGKTLKESRKLIMYMLEMVLLQDRPGAYPRELSGGMKQRVALARALMASSSTNLILLDEPLSALDAKIRLALRYELMKLVRKLRITCIYATQNTEEALMISDRIAIIQKGKIIQIDTPKEIYERPANLFVCRFISSSNFLIGTIKKLTDNGAIVLLDNENEVLVSNKNFPIDSKVVIAIRAENIKLIKGNDLKIQNCLYGIVETSKFVSGNSIEEIRLDSGELISSMKLTTKDWLKIGDKVTVSFDPNRILLFPYPKDGMESALDIF